MPLQQSIFQKTCLCAIVTDIQHIFRPFVSYEHSTDHGNDLDDFGLEKQERGTN